MSFISDLEQKTRNILIDLSEDIRNGDASVMVYEIEGRTSRGQMEEILIPVVARHEERIQSLDDDRYEKMVSNLATVVAETLAYDVLSKNRMIRSVTETMEKELKESAATYMDIVRAYEDDESSHHSRSRERNRSERGRERERRRDRSRTNTRYERDEDVSGRSSSRAERDDPEDTGFGRTRERTRNRGETRSRREEEQPMTQEVQNNLSRGERITKHNFALLSRAFKDVPFHYVGFERPVWDGEKVIIETLELEEFPVDYEKHRTDLYLSPNRATDNPGKAVESIERKLQDASETFVKAFIVKVNEETKEEECEVAEINVGKSCLVEGYYCFSQLELWGGERSLRSYLQEYLPNMNNEVVGVSVKHNLLPLTEEIRNSEGYATFMEKVDIFTLGAARLGTTKELLEAAAKFMNADAYDQLFQVINNAVFNTLSCSLKLGVKAASFIDSWTSIEKLLRDSFEGNPLLSGVINTNISSMVPTIFIEDGQICISRNYIFLPVSKNELIIGSPIRYATIPSKTRPELFRCISKLAALNHEVPRPLVSMVTLENESLLISQNYEAIDDAAYYIFQPI